MMSAPLHILYLDFDGVLHPDSAYETRDGIRLLHYPGHELFEHVRLLEQVLEPYPDVRIVISSSWLLIKGGYEQARARLSEPLRQRCIGGTFHRKYTRKGWFECQERHTQVLDDARRRQPAAWLAVDDAFENWPTESQHRLVRADPVLGISAPQVLADLKTKLQREFGGKV